MSEVWPVDTWRHAGELCSITPMVSTENTKSHLKLDYPSPVANWCTHPDGYTHGICAVVGCSSSWGPVADLDRGVRFSHDSLKSLVSHELVRLWSEAMARVAS